MSATTEFVICLAAVLVGIAAGIDITNWLFSSTKDRQPPPDKAPPCENRPDSPSANFAALIDAIRAEAQANRDEEKREDFGAKWREWLVIGLLAFTLYYLGAQIEEMKRVYDPIKTQAEASKIQAEASKIAANAASKQAVNAETSLAQTERAWVGPVDASFDKAPIADEEIFATIQYRNTGREPATSFVPVDNPDVFTFTDEEDRNGITAARIGKAVDQCIVTPVPVAAQVVYPSVGFTSYNMGIRVKKELIDNDVVEGRKTIAIQGCFVYRTVGTIHHSTWCFLFQVGKQKIDHLGICRIGNYAD